MAVNSKTCPTTNSYCLPQLSGNLSSEVLRGFSAYEVAVQYGFEGTEEEWLANLQGKAVVLKEVEGSLYWKYDNEDDESLRLLSELNFNGEREYPTLLKKPKINSLELVGNLSLEELGIQEKGDYIKNEQLTIILDEKLQSYVTEEELQTELLTPITIEEIDEMLETKGMI